MRVHSSSASVGGSAAAKKRQQLVTTFEFHPRKPLSCYNKDRTDWLPLEMGEISSDFPETCCDYEECAENGSVTHRCVVCSKKATTLCTKCSNAQYCDEQCEIRDRRNHYYLVCRQFDDGKSWLHLRPSKDHHRAFLFHPRGINRSGFCWIRACRNGFESDDPVLLKYQQPDEYWESSNVFLVAGPAEGKVGPDRRLADSALLGDSDHWVVLWEFEEDNPQFTTINRTLAEAAKFPLMLRNWFGPLLVVAACDRSVGAPILEDVGCRDLRCLIDWLNYNPQNPCVPLRTQSLNPYSGLEETLPGLKFNSPRDIYEAMRIFPDTEIPSVEPVLVPLHPFAGHHQYPCSKAFNVGLRWYLREADLDKREDPTFEPLLQHLRFGVCYPKFSTSFEAYTFPYDDDEHEEVELSGSQILVHPSGQPISFWHVMALDRFLAGYETVKSGSDMPSKSLELSAEGFKKFWDEFKISNIPESTTVSDPWAPEEMRPFNSAFEIDVGTDPDVVIYRKGLQQKREERWANSVANGIATHDFAYPDGQPPEFNSGQNRG